MIINSADRDWFNTNHENRYSFQVRFNPDSDSLDCGIQNIFKNIVSFEIIRVLMPVENIIIPFDNRIYIDLKSLPYVVLRIEEIEGLYNGTNSNTNKAFAQLLWDKDHTTEVVANPQSEDTAGTTFSNLTKSYARQFKRGFSSMAPMSFEKKTFYPTPLSALNRLSLAMETPYGETILNHPDVLNIKSISVVNMDVPDLFELSDSRGFPFKASKAIIEIRAHTYFSNRVFKIGDLIQIKGCTANALAIDANLNADFINRERGHYIVNLEKEVSAKATADNEGYIQKIYIAPPGTYNNVAETSTDIITNESVVGVETTIYSSDADINNTDGKVTTLGTNPNTLLNIGDYVLIDSQYKTVVSIDSTSQFTVDSAFSSTKHNQDVVRYSSHLFYEDTNSGACKLLNKSLQTHFTFKITTREEDIHSHMLSSNV